MSAAPVSVADVQKALADFKDPETGLAAAGQKQIRDLEVRGNVAALTLALSTHSAAIREETKQRLIDFLRARLPGLTEVTVELAVHERPPQKLGQVGLTAKSVIAVGSGKGGVSKSTIAAALALGDHEEVRSLLETVDRIPRGKVPQYLHAHAARVRAHLAASDGDVEATEAGFKRATSTFRELSTPLWIGVSLLEHAEWLVAEGRAAAAEVLLTEARQTFERLEARPWLERTDRVAGLQQIPA